MLPLVATDAANNAFHIGLVLTAFGFGFRHGIDWDHIAALTDITSSQDEPKRSMWFASLYALGHALVVFLLGFAAIVFAQSLPAGVDEVMERFVGATLVILGCYVFYALARQGRDFRMRSRWMLVFSGMRWGAHWLRARAGATPELVRIEHEHGPALAAVVVAGAGAVLPDHRHLHVAPMPDDPFANYAPRTAFSIGMIHGIGAETPTQLLIFVTAAGAAGKMTGLVLLGAFILGLLASNSAVACAGTFGFLGATRNFTLYLAVSCVTAAFSLVIGTIFLFGSGALLPALLGG